MNRVHLVSQRATNLLSTAGLGAALLLLVWGVGSVVLGSGWLPWALGAAVVSTMLGSAQAPELVLAARRGRLLRQGEVPELSLVVQALSARAGLPVAPRLALVPSPQLEAFTVGRRDRGVVALSPRMLRLPRRELIAVLAHEVSHLRHRDLFVLGMARSLGAFGRFVAQFGLFLALLTLPAACLGGQGVPLVALGVLVLTPGMLLRVEQALSRSREFDADAGAAELTGDPAALAAALARVEADARRANPSLFRLGRAAELPPWLRSHPETGERIRRLKQLTFRYG